MTNKEMQKVIEENLKAYLPNNKTWNIESKRIVKNNDTPVDAVVVKTDLCESVIAVAEVVEKCNEGVPLDTILYDFAQLVLETMERRFTLDDVLNQITNFEFIKNRIVAELVNTSANRERLSGVVRREKEDLSIVYKIIVEKNKLGNSLITVTDDILKSWNISEETLYHAAMNNTNKIRRAVVRNIMDCIIYGSSKQYNVDDDVILDIDENDEMVMMSNEQGAYGAIYMFDTDILSRVAEKMNTETLYVFPSSVHEIVLCPGNKIDDPNYATQMVIDVNSDSEAVSEQDFLSDHAYFFDKTTMQVVSL